MELLILALATFAGAATLRLTGLGFSLIASSFFVLVNGPVEGVLLSNLMTPVTSAMVLSRTWRKAQVGRAMMLAVPALLAVPLGAYVSRVLPTGELLIVIGCFMLVALYITAFDKHLERLGNRLGAIELGALSGFFNATAGLGGAGLAIYARATRWELKRFVPSAQVYLFTINIGSVLVKGPPHVSAGVLAVLVLAAMAGTVLGSSLVGEVRARNVRKFTLWLAFAGGVLTIVKGIAAL